jgi:hypothetical protein
MLKATLAHLRAAVALIVAEDIKALRILVRNIAESFAKVFPRSRKGVKSRL